MKTFILTGFSHDCARLFDVELRLAAATLQEAAAALGCSYLETPALESAIVRELIADKKGHLCLNGHPRITTVASAAPDIDGPTLVGTWEAWRLFISEPAARTSVV
ncbi:MAG TPA: hypothetical protein VL500_02035 [Candidatus Eisenbacteria bacterium]|jgi:hypothetical protein|nr:hypothetical protein [Candidatus Eisenbacteria bacterium]